MKITTIRKIVQTFIFLGMFIVPFLNVKGIYFIRGTFISMDIGALAIADPVMVLQTFITGGTIAVAAITTALIPIFLALIFGTVWCGWGCPYTFVAEILEKVPILGRRFKSTHAKTINKTQTKRTLIIRYLIFILLLSLAGVLGLPLLHLFSPPAILSTQALLAVKGFNVTAELLFIVVILIIDIFISYRFVCRYVCPTGACLGLIRTTKTLKVHYAGECIKCDNCIKECLMCINPMMKRAGATQRATNSGLCYNCGRCIDVCPDETKPLSWI